MVKRISNNQLYIIVGLIILAACSFFLIADSKLILEINKSTITYLNEKREQVMALTLLSGGISTAITIVPGDFGMPLAENIADIADYLVLVYAGIWIQKYIVIVASSFVFKVFVPISCLLTGINLLYPKSFLMTTVKRLAMLSILLVSLVPASVSLSKNIEATYQYSIEEKIETVKNQKETIENENKKNKSYFEKITSGFGAVVNWGKDKLEQLESTLANLLDATVVLIITCCGIPIMVMMIFIWSIKYVFNKSMDINKLNLRLFRKYMEQHQKFVDKHQTIEE